MKKSVYFAAPLFSEAEREFNEKTAGRIEATGFNVLLPQRRCAHLNSDTSLQGNEKNKTIFQLCLDDSLESDIFLFILDGRSPDEGASVELGVSYAQKILGIKPDKILIGLKTDWRICFSGSDLNQMISGCLDQVFTSVEDLLEYLVTLREE